MEKQEHRKCPECGKSFKHLITHLINRHAWDVNNFNRKMDGSETAMAQDNETKIEAEKDPETALESDIKQKIEVLIDELVWVQSLREMDNAISNMYEKIEACMKNIMLSTYMIDDWEVVDEPKVDTLKRIRDKPKLDTLKRIRKILKPSSEHLHETVIHELSHIGDQLKLNLRV